MRNGSGHRPNRRGASAGFPSQRSDCSRRISTGWPRVELGCGTAYVSALARSARRSTFCCGPHAHATRDRAHPAGCDWAPFPLIRAAGEQVPLRTGAFDFIISEYGAAIWADPYVWIPEAARLLRPGGELVFLGNSSLLMLCAPDEDDVPASDRLLRDSLRDASLRLARRSDGGVPSRPRRLDPAAARNDFVIEELIELRPPPGKPISYGFVTAEWARRWPAEEAWRVRRA